MLAGGLLVAVVVGVTGGSPLTVAASRFSLTGIYNQRGETYLQQVAAELRGAGVKVVMPADAAGRLDPDEQDRLFRCRIPAEDCAVDLAKALEVGAVLEGSIARPMGQASHEVRLLLRAATDGELLVTVFEAGVDECCLAAAVQRSVEKLAADLQGAGAEELARAPRVHSVTTSPLFRRIAWASLAVSGAAMAGAGVLLKRRIDLLNEPRSEHPVPGDIRQLYANAEQLRVLGIASAAVAGVALISWGVFLWLGLAPTPIEPVLALGPGGGDLGLLVRF